MCVEFVRTISVYPFEKNAVGAERHVYLLALNEELRFRKICIARESNFRAARFTRPGNVKCGGSMLHAATPRNNGHCKDILFAVEFARRYGRVEKNVPIPTTFLADRLPLHYTVCRIGEINGKRSKKKRPNIYVHLEVFSKRCNLNFKTMLFKTNDQKKLL